MEDFESIWITSLIILIIAYIISFVYKVPSSRVGNKNQIPKSSNPPPPKFSNKTYIKMSYNNSTDRVKALEALSRSFNLILSMPLDIRTECGKSLLDAITQEANQIKRASENDTNCRCYSEAIKSTTG